MNNPNFNYGEFAIIKNKSGLNNFKISIKEFVEKPANENFARRGKQKAAEGELLFSKYVELYTEFD